MVARSIGIVAFTIGPPASFAAGGNQVCNASFQIALDGIGQVFPHEKKTASLERFSQIFRNPHRLFPYQLPHTAAFHQTQDQPVF